MHKLSLSDGPYSATCNSQPLTFIEEGDYLGNGADNTQASEFNYELTFPQDATYNGGTTQTQHSQLDLNASQLEFEGDGVSAVTRGMENLNTLNFEEDEEDMCNNVDLPKHACA